MKTILVLAGGNATDDAVFATAHAVAAPLGAHLEVLHVRLTPGAAAPHMPHMEFVAGSAINEALSRLHADAEARSADGAGHFKQFCGERQIAIASRPASPTGLSANWLEETDNPVAHMLRHARHNDAILIGRAARA